MPAWVAATPHPVLPTCTPAGVPLPMSDADLPPFAVRSADPVSLPTLATLGAGVSLGLAAWLGWHGHSGLACAALAGASGLTGALLARRQVAQAAARLLDETVGPSSLPPADRARGGGPPALRAVPELQPLSDGLQRMLLRQQALFEAQAEQLELLRVQAHSDPLTGLPNRRHFTATLDAVLTGENAPAETGLVLLRLRDLSGMNQRIGHSATDHVLQAVGQTLLAYPSRIERCCVGRLGGADFALLLPVGGLAVETAESLVHALRLPFAGIDPSASVSAGAVELQSPTSAAAALSLARAALNQAEAAAAGLAATTTPRAAPPAPPTDAAVWQQRNERALDNGWVALGAYPVCTPDGRQLHLDSPLRVRLRTHGLPEPASRWLSRAIRNQLSAQVDERALMLALDATRRDGLARCINLAAQSVADEAFVDAMTIRLEAAPEAACRLWIDLPESLALDQPERVRALSRRWRPLGVRLGLEHAGERLARIPQLISLGLDCVRIDGRFVNGIDGVEADSARRYLQGLVRLGQSVGLQVFAEGVRSEDDLAHLWSMGFDAATGPALQEDLVEA